MQNTEGVRVKNVLSIKMNMIILKEKRKTESTPEFGEFGGEDTGSSVLRLPQEFLSTVA